jgi:hypothetical protein
VTVPIKVTIGEIEALAQQLKWLDIVPLIITLVADLVQNVADGFDQLEKYATNALARMQALKGDLSDVSGSRGGVWPTADFSFAD